MPDLSSNGSRRKRLSSAQAASSSHEGAGGIVRLALLAILAIVTVTWLIAPNQIDRALAPITSGAEKKGAEANQIWTTVVSTLSSEDTEEQRNVAPGLLANGTTLRQSEPITATGGSQSIMTRSKDVLDLQAEASITLDESDPNGLATIVKLINGTIHVDAAERKDGQTLSIETIYLVATVKGTKFDVVIADGGSAVSVTEGVVAVRAIGSSDSVDVTPGNTAVVSAIDGSVPYVARTPAGGSAEAIRIARAKAQSPGGEPLSSISKNG